MGNKFYTLIALSGNKYALLPHSDAAKKGDKIVTDGGKTLKVLCALGYVQEDSDALIYAEAAGIPVTVKEVYHREILPRASD